MKIERFQNRFYNDITLRTFFRFIPETEEEETTMRHMVDLLRQTQGALKFEGVEKGFNGGEGPVFWVPWNGYFKKK